jgi:hypothetical protein
MSRSIDVHPPVGVGRKEQFKSVCNTDLKAYGDLADINVARVAVKVTPSRTNREFTLSEGFSIIDGKKACRATDRATRSNRRSRISGVFDGPPIPVLRGNGKNQGKQ